MNTSKAVTEVQDIINLETKAWNEKDLELLLSIFHPDFVWVWPKDNKSHNPIDWELPLGKFNYNSWKGFYSEMFGRYKLVKNERKIIEIKISEDSNGAFAVVDVDTVWEDSNGKHMNWLGRSGKTYVKTNQGWKLISHFGLLLY